MTSVFTRIIDGDEPAYFVWRDDVCVGFMDNAPLTDGHVLVVPRQEIDHWTNMDPATQARLFEVVGHVGRAIDEVFDCRRVGVMIAGYEVPHTHVHVFATNSLADFSFARKHGSRSPADLAANADRLRDVLRNAG